MHRSVVCPQSPVLASICETNLRENYNVVVEHKVFDSDTVELVVQHLYAGGYGDTGRLVSLSLLEREHEDDATEKEKEKGEAVKEETEREEVEGDRASVSGNENGSGKGVRRDVVDAVDVDAAATDAAAVAGDAAAPFSSRSVDELVAHARVYGLANYY
jgi:hypothetical protein